MAKELPARTAAFIRSYIASLEQLEILLMLRERREQAQTVEGIYEAIRSNPQSIALRLEQMIQQGLVQVASEGVKYYLYQPATPDLAAAIDELAVVYKEHRVSVIEHIFAERPSSIQGFADSFRIRKSENNG